MDDTIGSLSKITPGFVEYDLFEQLARLCVLSIIEFVPLRMVDGEVEVLLLNRGADDPLWPNELHTPGTVIRPTDIDGNGSYQPFERIKQELGGVQYLGPVFVGSILHRSRRGGEHAQVYWVEVTSDSNDFYEVNSLPKNTMESQLDFIKLAADNFRQIKAQAS